MRIFLPYLITVIFSAASISHSIAQVFSGNNGIIRFESDAPLELISASSNELKGAINLEDGSFAFTLDNGSFKGFNSPLQQEHFYENYIEVDKYPRSTFTGKIIEPIGQGQGEFSVRAKGILNIHGVEQERIIRSVLTLEEGKTTLQATFTLMLRDHNIEIPRVVNQKIAEEITVSVELEMLPKNDQ